MRLYLSSFRLGNQPQRLVDLVGANKQVAVILNACDVLTPYEREIRRRQEFTALQRLGFQPQELDLRAYFYTVDNLNELSALMTTFGMVWVRGGNPFVLRRAMQASGFDNIIVDMLERDAIVYGGFSAGIVMLTPTLRGLELVDDPYITPAYYKPDIIWDCFNLLPYSIAPHYKSDHPESPAIDGVVSYFIARNMPFKALQDGEVIVVEDLKEETTHKLDGQ